MTDAAAGLSILHVIVRAGPTNSQYNEHCLPVLDTRRISVCSLFPADVQPPDGLHLFEGDGTVRGCFRALRRALVEDYDVVHVHAPASGVVTLLTYLRLARSRRDLVFTVHNSWQNFRLRNRLFLRLIMMLFPLIVVCGRAAFESLPTLLQRRHRHKLHVVANGVDVDRIDGALGGVTRHEGRPGFRVVSINRLIPLKHPHTTLTAFTTLRKHDDELVLVGDGPMRAEIEDRIQREGLLRSVHLRGVIPRDDVYRELGRADVFVSTSGGEGLPVALLEAMACGVPVVVSDIPPHREVARAAHGLPLVPVGDTQGFARALTRVRNIDPDERKRVARRLRACVVENYSVRAMNRAYGEIYRAVVPRGSEVRRAAERQVVQEVQVGLAEKMHHRLGLLITLSVLGAATGYGIGYVQAPVFKGETTMEVGEDLSVTANEDTLKTSAALAVRYADLARREPVLQPLVDEGYADDWRQLQRNVFARPGDKNPQMVEISVYAGDQEEARRLATAVADSLTTVSRSAVSSSDRSFLGQQVSALERDIVRTTRELDDAQSALAQVPPEEAARLRSRIESLQSQLADQRSSYADLNALDTSESGKLSPVDQAWTTRSPLRPAPLVLAAAGAAVGLTLAAAWVHLFSQRPITPEPAPKALEPTRGDEARHRSTNGNGRPRPSTWATPNPPTRPHRSKAS